MPADGPSSKSYHGDDLSWEVRAWDDIIKSCLDRLVWEDSYTVTGIDSGEELFERLDSSRDTDGEHLIDLKYLIGELDTTQISLTKLIDIFVSSMRPATVPTIKLVWGFLYVAAPISQIHVVASRSKLLGAFTKEVFKLRDPLGAMQRICDRIDQAAERGAVRIGLLRVFKALLEFCTGCAVLFRKAASNSDYGLQYFLKSLEQMGTRTAIRLEGAVESLNVHSLPAIQDRQSHRQFRPHGTVRVETATFPVVILPNRRITKFVGRLDVLNEIDQHFVKGAIQQDLTILTLCGIGGIGKTELAYHYARRYAFEYEAVLWVSAETSQSLRRGFAQIARALGLVSRDNRSDPDHHVDLVQEWFQSTDRQWLLIFDQMEKYSDIKGYLPSSNSSGSVIITSRYTAQANIYKQKVSIVTSLSNKDAQDLFMALLEESWDGTEGPDGSERSFDKLEKEEQDAVGCLLEQMDGLPLGIQQIVALIRFKDSADNIAKFADRYKRQLHGFHRDDHLAEHTLHTLWKGAFNTIQAQRDPWVILGVLSFLRAEGIPEDIFYPTGNNLVLPGALSICHDEDEVDDAIDKLKEIGLIERKKDGLSLHRLVQTAFLIQPDESLDREARQDLFDFASLLVRHAFPKQKGGRPMYERWEQCAKLAEQARALAISLERLKVAKYRLVPSEDFFSLMSSCAWYLCERGTPREALRLLHISVDSHPNREGLSYANLLNIAMMSYFRLNDKSNARKALEKNCAIRERLLHPDDEDLAVTYQNFGNLLMAESQLDKADDYIQRSLDTVLALPGTEVVQAQGYLSQGRVLFLRGQDHYDEAAEKYRRCEELYLKDAGSEGYSMVEYGNLELARHQHEVALDRFNQAKAILLKHTPDVLKVAATYYKIGCAELGLGNVKNAMAALKEGLEIAKSHLEDGEREEARILGKQAEVLEKSAGHDPDVILLAASQRAEHLRRDAELLLVRLGKRTHTTVEDLKYE
ncbi:hypothetical protein QBC44DRAFT_388576 [Cladorrhinum sp. PSN332]|nr:hypothetical protein QBC44DRAFT_388576 [Cladorrhinum sp. PSN332]